MYQIDGSQLRVCGKILRQDRNREVLKDCRVILLEHVLATTAELIKLMRRAGVEVFALLPKPYSINTLILRDLAASGLRIERKSYHELETTEFLDGLLAEAASRCRIDGKRILIFEVGGYFAEPLSRVAPEVAQHIAGVVEDTTFGHNRYLARAGSIAVPVFSVARSALKEVEAMFVGRDAVIAVDSILRGIGVSLPGRRALVVGYGMIGTNIAKSLKSFGLEVSVYDKHAHRNLHAFMDGFMVQKKLELLKRADIVFSATGEKAVSCEEVEACHDSVVLASVGSQDSEFDISGLRQLSVSVEPIGEHIVRYSLPNSRQVVVLKEGTAVNFAFPSLAVEVIDLVFAEILVCGLLLLKRADIYPPSAEVYCAAPTYLNEIARDWLKFVNPLH